MQKIRRAILSCYDKTGAVELARALDDLGVEIISTSGTLAALRGAGIAALSIEEFTGVEELMDGRVKSLHPKVHAGLLGVRDNKLHSEQLQSHEYAWIDLVVVNPRPVEDLIARQGAAVENVLDQVDMGGMAMIRSAAKNLRYVTVVVNPERYAAVIHEMRALDGGVSFATRFRLAQEAFACTAAYDAALAEFLRVTEPPVE